MSKVSRHKLAAVVADRTLHGADRAKLAREVAAYLLSERRTAELESLLRDIVEYRADRGFVEAQATSAHPLTDPLRSDIERQIRQIDPQAKQVNINEEVDESVLAAIRLELANRQFDASARSKLNHFKQLTGKDK
jgi:F0F1-type ATP synthase delta subunit